MKPPTEADSRSLGVGGQFLAAFVVLLLSTSLLDAQRQQTEPVKRSLDAVQFVHAILADDYEPPLTVSQAFFHRRQFRRGDSNVDGFVDISDASTTLESLFLGSHDLRCRNAADTNRDGGLDLTDAVFLLQHLFSTGPAPGAPGIHECGIDRSPGALSCDAYPLCPGDMPLVGHVLNRMTFGPTEELYERIQTRAELIAYIDQQLDAPMDDAGGYDQALHEPEIDAALEALGIGFGTPGGGGAKVGRLGGSLLVNAVDSEWQLLHVLTHFWNNHFHSQIDTLRMSFFSKQRRGGTAVRATAEGFAVVDEDASETITQAEWEAFRALYPSAIAWEGFQPTNPDLEDPTADGVLTLNEFLTARRLSSWKYTFGREQFAVSADVERREYDQYRRLAFGRFRDLLEASAKSTAMLIYLNGFENTLQAPNENHAREFLELHSLGVDAVYTQRDIEEISRVLTGWTVGWVERAGYLPVDMNFSGRPTSPTFPIDNVVPDVPPYLRYPTEEFWDDTLYTWAFVFGNSGRNGRFGDGHDWGRKDLFLPRFGGVDSLGNPLSPLSTLSIAENNTTRTTAAAMQEFDEVLGRVVGFRDCAKFISTKLIQLFVTDDLSLLKKTSPMPADLQVVFDAVDRDGDGTLDLVEWSEPIPLVLPNGRPPRVFAALDVDGNDRVTALEYQEPDLLVEAMDAWTETDGSIREVVRVILHSGEFLSLKFYRAKVRTAFEVAAATVRALGGTFNETLLRRTVDGIRLGGNELFQFAEPTGESELAIDNMDTSKLLGRLQLLNRGARPVRNSVRPFLWDFRPTVSRWNLESAEDVVDYYSLLLLGGDILENQRELILAATAAGDVRTAVGLLLSAPQFQKQ